MLHFWRHVPHDVLGVLGLPGKHTVVGCQILAAQQLSHPAVTRPAVPPSISYLPAQLLLWLLGPSLYLLYSGIQARSQRICSLSVDVPKPVCLYDNVSESMRAESCQPSCRAFAGRPTCKACNITFPLVDWEDMHRAERSCEGENGLHLLKPVSHLDYTEVMILLISEWNFVASMLLSLHEEVAACTSTALIKSFRTTHVEKQLV